MFRSKAPKKLARDDFKKAMIEVDWQNRSNPGDHLLIKLLNTLIFYLILSINTLILSKDQCNYFVLNKNRSQELKRQLRFVVKNVFIVIRCCDFPQHARIFRWGAKP